MVNAQEWLDKNYPKEERNKITKLYIRDKNFEGFLDLRDFKNLEELNCSNDYLTGLNVSGLEKLKKLYCHENKLNILKLTGCFSLDVINASYNNLNEINLTSLKKIVGISLSNNFQLKGNLSIFKECEKLEWLELNDTSLHGSLQPLQGLVELKELQINNTYIDSGLEYLSKNIKDFRCSAGKRKDAKRQVIFNLLANDQGEAETNKYGYIKNFPQKFQEYKNWKKSNFTEEEIKEWTALGFRLYDLDNALKWEKEFGLQGTKQLIKVGFEIDELDQAKNWKDKNAGVWQIVGWIKAGFTPQDLSKFIEWKKLNFTEEETKSWLEISLATTDFDFADYLKKERKLIPQTAKNKLVLLRNEYKWWQKGFSFKQTQEWINAGFELKDINCIKQWKDKNFTAQKTREWINAGAEIDDASFISWLRDTKKYTPERIIIANYQENYQLLRNRFKIHGLCSKCSQLNNYGSCQVCESISKPVIDKFISKRQIDWIPYNKFKNIKHLTNGGFSKVYKAEWNDKMVVLKSLNNSQNITTDFLREIFCYSLFVNDEDSMIVKCYGISQNPETGDYIMIMEYISDGNLRRFLSNNQLSFEGKIIQLWYIAYGLNSIHNKKLVHRDFHSGNILVRDFFQCCITDLGLCRPVNKNDDKKVYGVLPYIAPEVLRKKGYTPASDIYSWGIVAYEVITNLPPYPNLAHDYFLALKICQGLRPKFQIKIPKLLKDLIEKCWNAEPLKRPAANELNRILNNWMNEINNQENTEFIQQYKEKEQFLNGLASFDYKLHPEAFYTSRLLDFKNLPEPQNSREINEQFYKLKESRDLDSLRVDNYDVQTNASNEMISEGNQMLLAESEEIPPIEIKSEQLSSNSWQNIHPNFTEDLTQSWINHNLTYSQTQEWINIGLNPQDAEFANFLKNQKNFTPEKVLNEYNFEELKREFEQNSQQVQILQTDLPNWQNK